MEWFKLFNKARKKSKTRPFLFQFEDRVTPTVSLVGSFQGIQGTTGYDPPDTVMATGPKYIMESVNADIAIFDKVTGAKISQKPLAAFFPGTFYSGGLGHFDPLLMYDDDAGRFVVTSHVYDATAKKAYIDFAISNTSDPTQGFAEVYEVETDQAGTVWTDNGKIGFNATTIVYSGNNYGYDDQWKNQTVVISIDKSLALDSNPSTSGIFSNTRVGNFAMIPARMHGAAPTDPLLFFESNTGGGNAIQVTKGSNLLSNAPQWVDVSVPVSSYFSAINLPQPGSAVTVDSGDCRTQSVDWKNNVLVGAFNSSVGGDGAAAWIMMNAVPNSTPTLMQQGFIHPGLGIGTSYPSVALDSAGNLAMTYMEGSKTEFLSMYITGRSTSDPLGTLAGAFLVKAGDKALTNGDPNRGGDYSGTSIDPVDGSFWAANEYADKSINSWSTYIAHFTVSGLVTPVISVSASATSGYLGDSILISTTVSKPTPSDPVPTGTVDLIENNAVIATATLDENGKATFAPYILAVEGKSQLFVKYKATGIRYKDVISSNLIITASRRATTLTTQVKTGDMVVSSTPYGQTVTLLAYLGAPVQGPSLPTGSIEFFINSKSYGTRSVSLANNQLQAQINVDGLPLGSYTTYATYNGDPIYGTSVSTSLKFTVIKAATTTILTPQSNTAIVGETFAIQGLVAANIGAKVQGKVQFRLNGVLLGAPITVGTDGTVLLRNAFLLSQIGKNRQLTATFTDTSGNYSGSTSAGVPILITNTKTKINVPAFAKIGEQVTFSATVTQVPGSSGTLGGYVEFFDGIQSLGTAPVDGAGLATLQLPSLDARQYQIRARYVNTTGTGVADSGLTDPLTLLVSRGGPSVTFTSVPSAPKTYGDNISFGLEVRSPNVGLPIPTGTVIILFGTQEIQRVTLTGGGASFVLTPDQYQIGLNSVTASYLGDGNYASSDGTTVNFSVVKATTFTALELQTQAGAPVTGAVSYGSLLKIVTDVFNIPNDLPPNGSVTLFTVVDGKERVLGQVNLSTQGPGWSTSSFTVEKLPVGQYQIKARYSATDRYEASESDSVSLTIVPGTSSVSLVGESRFKAKGQTSLTAVVDDGTGNAPVGIVRFYNVGASKLLGEVPVTTDISGSVASLSFTNDFAAGPVEIRAEFISSKPGTQNASANQTLKIYDAPTNFTLVPNLTSVRVNDAVSLVVSLEVPVAGDFDVTKVRFYDNGVEVTPGIVSPFTPNGNKFTATFSLAMNTVGTHALTAKYLGSIYIDAAESSRADLLARARVVASTQTSAVVVTDSSGTAASGVLTGEKVKLSATVKNLTTTQNPDGSIVFVAIKGGVETVLGTVAVKPLSTNQATAELTLANGISVSGAYSVVARFQSGSDFTPSSSTGVNLKVVDGPAVVSFVGSANLPAGIATALTVKVDDGTGRSLPGRVNFFNDATNAPLGSADTVGGIATLTLLNGLPAGALRIRAEFVSSSYMGANSSVAKDFVFLADSQITVTTPLAAYKSTDLITITIGLDIPAALTAGQIQLYINSQLRTTLTPTWNAATGRYEATYQVTGLSVGTNRIMAKYLGTQFTAPKDSAVRTIVVRR